MDVFTLLEKDHEAVKGVMNKLVETSDGALKTREKLFKQLATELAVHAKIEEMLVYPRLKEIEQLKDKVEEGIEEHHEAEHLLAQLSEMAKDDDQWLPMMQQLQQAVEHHVQEEENEIFPTAREQVGEDEAEELANNVKQEKKEMMKGSHGAAKDLFERLGL